MASESQEPPSLVANFRSRVEPGATETLRLEGTAPPICTVTVMVWGASTALGSLTVTMPVAVPAGRAEGVKANWSGGQRPLRPLCDEQARCAPAGEGTIQGTDEEGVLRLSVPSAALYASTVCALPLAPWTMETGPTVDDTRRNRGAALRPAAQRKPAAASAAAPLWIRPTRGLPSYTPRCNRRPE